MLQRSALAPGRRIPTPSGMGSWGWRKKNHKPWLSLEEVGVGTSPGSLYPVWSPQLLFPPSLSEKQWLLQQQQ